MAHPAQDRLRDVVPANEAYTGMSVSCYEACIPIDDLLVEEPLLVAMLEEVGGGPALELGCGTGRPMLRLLAAGHRIEGIDSSADMLAALRRLAGDHGLAPVVHHGDLTALELDRRYRLIYCPAGTFGFVEPTATPAALASYQRHLEPGGVLAITLTGFSTEPSPADLVWRIRRTGTGPDGATYLVHEATYPDPDRRLTVVYNRIEVYGDDDDRTLVSTHLRKYELHQWERHRFEQHFIDAGLTDVHSTGDEHAWVTRGVQPAG